MSALALVVVASDDLRRVCRELRNTLEDIFRRVRCEVGDEFVVDRQIRRKDKEVVDAVCKMQVADEGTHQPCLADAGGKREAQRWKLALEVRHRREFAANGFQRGSDVRALLGRHDFGDAVENFQRVPLRRAQAQSASDGVDVVIHCVASVAKQRLLSRLRRCLWQVFDLQAVVVLAPLATGEHGFGNLLNRKIAVTVRPYPEGAAHDQQRSLAARLHRSIAEADRGSDLPS